MSEIIRVKYEKREEVKYVGHLDTMRTFIRCIKRTNIPVAYSKGFNPRIQISFALPLGVGVTSKSEYFDLTLENRMNVDVFLAELNSTLPVGYRVVEASYPEEKKSLMSLVKEAVYSITINDEIDFEKINELFQREEVLIEKKSDKHVIMKNIKEGILDFSINRPVCRFHVTAGSSNNVNPNSIVDAIENVAENEYPILAGYVDNNAYFIFQRDIIRAHIESRKVILETEEGTYNVRKSLVALENILNPTRFVRISQSEIINIYKVERFEFDIAGTIGVVFENGEKTWVSRSRVSNLKDIINKNH